MLGERVLEFDAEIVGTDDDAIRFGHDSQTS
jgi:hypothetical protein